MAEIQNLTHLFVEILVRHVIAIIGSPILCWYIVIHGEKKTKQAVEEANKEMKDITGKFQIAIGFSKAETMKALDKLKLLEQC